MCISRSDFQIGGINQKGRWVRNWRMQKIFVVSTRTGEKRPEFEKNTPRSETGFNPVRPIRLSKIKKFKIWSRHRPAVYWISGCCCGSRYGNSWVPNSHMGCVSIIASVTGDPLYTPEVSLRLEVKAYVHRIVTGQDDLNVGLVKADNSVLTKWIFLQTE